jgi:hypothetical protein
LALVVLCSRRNRNSGHAKALARLEQNPSSASSRGMTFAIILVRSVRRAVAALSSVVGATLMIDMDVNIPLA